MRKIIPILIILVSLGVGFVFLTRPAPAPTNNPASIVPVPNVVARVGPPQIYPLVPGNLNTEITPFFYLSKVCPGLWHTSSIRPPTSYTDPIKTQALAKYNEMWGTNYTKKDGELDHLISLELGGSPTSTDNLWFEPYNTQINGERVGAYEKDKVENLLHREVCDNVITLETAQRIILQDWYACYLKSSGGKTESCI